MDPAFQPVQEPAGKKSIDIVELFLSRIEKYGERLHAHPARRGHEVFRRRRQGGGRLHPGVVREDLAGNWFCEHRIPKPSPPNSQQTECFVADGWKAYATGDPILRRGR
jgi:hypothetical protein